jgi:hypothetical protein
LKNLKKGNAQVLKNTTGYIINFFVGPIGVGKFQISPYNSPVRPIQDIGGMAQDLSESDDVSGRYFSEGAAGNRTSVIGALKTRMVAIFWIGYHLLLLP